MEMKKFMVNLVGISCGVLILSLIWKAVNYIWLTPKRLERAMRKQGIEGPRYKVAFGNLKDFLAALEEARAKPMELSHRIAARVSPFLHRTIKKYGKTFFFWFGPTPQVNIMDPELLRDVLSNKNGHFAKGKENPVTKLLVTGLATYDGEKWAKHRRIINPAFHVEKLKVSKPDPRYYLLPISPMGMLPAFSVCCTEMVSRWEEEIGSSESCEVDVWPHIQILTADVISRTAFGSSYEEGRRIFQLLTEQAVLLTKDVPFRVFVPGYMYFPTRDNLRTWEIAREIRGILMSMIEKREKAMKMGEACSDDLLGLLMESNFKESQEKSSGAGMTVEDVIRECRLFYFAGQETTASLLTWTMIVLSMHPSWQERAREEVLQVFGKSKPDIEGLSQLKIVIMIFYEVLRLYPPVTLLIRRACKEMQLGGVTFPTDMEFGLPIMHIHHDPELWGDDADEFKPERFTEGISKATNNQVAFFPFGWGPRICVGQNFAIIESKLALAMILQRFSFHLSPSYAHAPYTDYGRGKSSGAGMTVEDVIRECRLFYFAGQETTASLLTWTMIVLSMHPSWQERAREEVLQVFGKSKPDIEGLSQLKIVTMIFYEVLRLYPPITLLIRRACKEMQLGGVTFPTDMEFGLPIMHIHHDPELWGDDADEFKPERFTEGISKATNNQVAFFPFGWGPRICIGQNFAIIESKLALAMILQRFSFHLSPSYENAPYTVITLRPQHGAPLILRKLL
ncbi:hypothetical protein ACLOJK_008416 [Asimina triloba]